MVSTCVLSRGKTEVVSGGLFFSGGIFLGDFFSGGFFLTPFPFDFFVALVKRLSVRGTQKRDKKSFTGSCV